MKRLLTLRFNGKHMMGVLVALISLTVISCSKEEVTPVTPVVKPTPEPPTQPQPVEIKNGVLNFLMAEYLGETPKNNITEIHFYTESDKTIENAKQEENGCYPIYYEIDGTVLNLYTPGKKFVLRNGEQFFYNFKSLKTLDLKALDTSSCHNMDRMFDGCEELEELDLTSFNTENVGSMNFMFTGCDKLSKLNLSSFNTSAVRSMSCMFLNCKNLKELDVSGFNTSWVQDMSGMFDCCSSLESLDVSNFDTKNVKSVSGMFQLCESLKRLNLSTWDTSNVTDMSQMFWSCISLEELNLSHFNTSKCTDMKDMFSYCSSLKSINLSSFDTSSVTDMLCLFMSCTSLESVDLSNFNTSNVTRFDHMFDDCPKLQFIDLSSFDLTKLRNCTHMFDNAGSLSKKCTIKCTKPTKDFLLKLGCGAANYVVWDIVEGGNASLYESKDFSQDGKVITLQKASEGNGIDMVIIGECYSDRFIADGSYHKKAQETMEAMFASEPLKSYRHLFNVYEVMAVSKNETILGSTALETTLDQVSIAGYANANWEKLVKYTLKAVDKSRMDNVTVAIMWRETLSREHAGWSDPEVRHGDYGEGMGVGYFGADHDPNDFDYVVLHEVIGHAFGKLGDEYHPFVADNPMEEGGDWFLKKAGISKNVDYTSDPTKIKWSKFLNDPRYEGTVGIYEGAETGYSSWRPSYESVMRGGIFINGKRTIEFNAPSREALYYRIHKLAYGDSWQYDYETFVQQDLKNIKTNNTTRAMNTKKSTWRDPKPVIFKNWRNYVK